MFSKTRTDDRLEIHPFIRFIRYPHPLPPTHQRSVEASI
jgi:hypothetical protein